MEVIIITDKGKRLKITEMPYWNGFHKRFYAAGYRWIESRGAWSGSKLLHNFKRFIHEDSGSRK